MDGEINKDGFMYLNRAGSVKRQWCPYASNVKERCGDHCPLFMEAGMVFLGEPEEGLEVELTCGKSSKVKYLLKDKRRWKQI